WLLSIIIIAAQQQADEKSDADGDQQRLPRIRSHVAAHLIGDRAEVDVFDFLAHAVVAALHRARRLRVLFAGVLLRARETAGLFLFRPAFAGGCRSIRVV